MITTFFLVGMMWLSLIIGLTLDSWGCKKASLFFQRVMLPITTAAAVIYLMFYGTYIQRDPLGLIYKVTPK